MKKYSRLLISILLLLSILVLKHLLGFLDLLDFQNNSLLNTIQKTLLIACSSWILIELVHIIKIRLLNRYDISNEDNLKSRKLHTQHG